MAERLITVFGGSGFVGRHLVNQLADEGWRVRVAVRDPEGAKFLKPLGDLGQITPVPASLLNPESIKRACAGADVVINLVGILHESGKASFQAIHADGAALVAEAARAANLRRLIDEYRRTERRARALENVLLPEIDHSLKFIEEQLDAVDQEEAVRVRNAARGR